MESKMYWVTAGVVKVAVAICAFLVQGIKDFVLYYLNRDV